MCDLNSPKDLKQSLEFPKEIIRITSAEKLIEVIKFIAKQKDLNNPRVDYIEILFSIASEAPYDQVRYAALKALTDIFRQRNTSLAIPLSILKELKEVEVSALKVWTDRLEKLTKKASIEKYPAYWFETDDLGQFANSYLKGREMERKISRESKVLTLGSCFAINIAEHLQVKGINAKGFELSELVNNSYTNLYLLEVMSAGKDFLEESKLLQPDMIEGLKNFFTELPSATHIIFTLGLSLAFFSKTDGMPLREPLYSYRADHYHNYEMRAINLSENVENIKKIIMMLEELAPNSSVILSLSPIPLDGTKDFSGSVVEADCISKSIGRASIAYLQQDSPSLFYYFPSYELIRWVAANQNRRLFGGANDDGYLRHVNPSILREVLEVFVSMNCVN